MTDGDPDASPEYISRVASALASAGFPRMPANVLMTLTGAAEPALTADRLGARLGASAAAISGAVRYLENLGMVRRHRAPGERRYSWEITDGGWYTATLQNTDLYGYLVRLSTEELERLPEGSPVRRRIADFADFMTFVSDAMPRLLEEWRADRQR